MNRLYGFIFLFVLIPLGAAAKSGHIGICNYTTSLISADKYNSQNEKVHRVLSSGDCLPYSWKEDGNKKLRSINLIEIDKNKSIKSSLRIEVKSSNNGLFYAGDITKIGPYNTLSGLTYTKKYTQWASGGAKKIHVNILSTAFKIKQLHFNHCRHLTVDQKNKALSAICIEHPGWKKSPNYHVYIYGLETLEDGIRKGIIQPKAIAVVEKEHGEIQLKSHIPTFAPGGNYWNHCNMVYYAPISKTNNQSLLYAGCRIDNHHYIVSQINYTTACGNVIFKNGKLTCAG